MITIVHNRVPLPLGPRRRCTLKRAARFDELCHATSLINKRRRASIYRAGRPLRRRMSKQSGEGSRQSPVPLRLIAMPRRVLGRGEAVQVEHIISLTPL